MNSVGFRAEVHTKPGWKLFGIPAIVAAVLFSGVLGHDFAYDDGFTRPIVESGAWWGPGALRPTSRSLTYAFHYLDFVLWDGWAPGYHLTNLVLHALASGIAALAGARVARSRRVGLVCGLLFAVHPVHVEVVAAIAFRKDSLAMIFVGLALWLWLRRPRSVWAVGLATACYGLGLYAKEVAVAPLAAFLPLTPMLHRDGEPAASGRPLRRLLWMLPVLAVGLAVVYASLRNVQFQSPDGLRFENYGDYFVARLAAIPSWFRLLFAPLLLSYEYPPHLPASVADPRVALGVGLVLVWCGTAVLLCKRHPVPAFAMLWVVGMSLGSGSVVPHHILVADRYLYVPSFGGCLLLAWLAHRYGRRPRTGPWAYALLFVALVLGGLRSNLRAGDWRDNEAVARAALRDGVDLFGPRATVGRAELAAGRHEEAERHFRRACELGPNCIKAWNGLGVALLKMGRIDESIATLHTATELRPLDGQTRYNLGVALQMDGDIPGAVAELRAACETGFATPPMAYHNLGCLLAELGDDRGAADAFHEAVRRMPDFVGSRVGLGEAWIALGEVERGQALLQEAQRMERAGAR